MQQLHPDDVIWRNARLATLATGEAEPYGLREQHALVVRGQTILAIIPESEIPSGIVSVSISTGVWLPRPDRLPHPSGVRRRSRSGMGSNGLTACHIRPLARRAAELTPRSRPPATVRRKRSDGAQQRLQRLMNEGVTTVEIKSGYGLNAEAEEKMLLVARQLSLNNLVDISPTLLAAHAVPAEYRQDPDAYLALVCERIMPTLWQKSYLKRWTCFENVGFTRHKPSACSGPPPRSGSVKGHVEQLSNLGGAALVSQYKGLSGDHIEYILMMKVFRRWRKAARWRYCSPGVLFSSERQRPPVAAER